MPVTPTQPIIVPSKSLDKIWVTSFSSMSQGPNKLITLNIILTPYNESGDEGTGIVLGPYDVAEICLSDPEAAAIYGAILAWVEKKAKAEGKI